MASLGKGTTWNNEIIFEDGMCSVERRWYLQSYNVILVLNREYISTEIKHWSHASILAKEDEH